jgi:hypothetical protein
VSGHPRTLGDPDRRSRGTKQDDRARYPGWVKAELTIVCVDCGGDCHLISHADENGEFEPGEIVAYRCRDCLDRWDLVLPDDEDDTYSHAD